MIEILQFDLQNETFHKKWYLPKEPGPCTMMTFTERMKINQGKIIQTLFTQKIHSLT